MRQLTVCQVLFAAIPPTELKGGWLTFGAALCGIGLLTAAVGDLASLLGCVLGLGDTFTAITIVALGTSLPDTFASQAAARNDQHADAAIGNITGSNSVNVFLGLGLPWTISAIYYAVRSCQGHDVHLTTSSRPHLERLSCVLAAWDSLSGCSQAVPSSVYRCCTSEEVQPAEEPNWAAPNEAGSLLRDYLLDCGSCMSLCLPPRSSTGYKPTIPCASGMFNIIAHDYDVDQYNDAEHDAKQINDE